MKETLIILAAGMGSRYGGLKQIDTVGNNGEAIIDFTIYDAIKAGFKKLILIIRKEHEEAFENNLVHKIRPFIEVEYAYQDLNDLPIEINIPEDRIKPWGTTHALLSCRHILNDDPFVICNADDFYGRESFEKAYAYMHENNDDYEYAIVGYKIINTLSKNGTVTRALCKKDDDGYLYDIVETSNIYLNNDEVVYQKDDMLYQISKDNLVSMNYWIFKPNIIPLLNELFIKQAPSGIENNPLKYEALLPNDIDTLIKNNKCKVKVLQSDSKWFGVTYKEDKPSVIENINQFKNNNIYPQDLWKKE